MLTAQAFELWAAGPSSWLWTHERGGNSSCLLRKVRNFIEHCSFLSLNKAILIYSGSGHRWVKHIETLFIYLQKID